MTSAVKYLDKNPKVYHSFMACDLPFHVLIVIMDSSVEVFEKIIHSFSCSQGTIVGL
jgi:hypothetical protein